MNALAIFNFIIGVYTYITVKDIAHLIIASIYCITIGPIFAIFKWRFKKCVRFLPAILFVAIAVYISALAMGVNKNIVRGLDSGNDQFMSLYGSYIISIFALG